MSNCPITANGGIGGLWFCAKVVCVTVPIVPLQSPTLVQRFLVNITLAFLAKYTVVSKPPISSVLRCFALVLVWYALMCTIGSSFEIKINYVLRIWKRNNIYKICVPCLIRMLHLYTSIFTLHVWYQVKYRTPRTCLRRDIVNSHELLLSLSRMRESSSVWATWRRKWKNDVARIIFHQTYPQKGNTNILFDGVTCNTRKLQF